LVLAVRAGQLDSLAHQEMEQTEMILYFLLLLQQVEAEAAQAEAIEMVKLAVLVAVVVIQLVLAVPEQVGKVIMAVLLITVLAMGRAVVAVRQQWARFLQASM
jgi:hypothetical protein